MRIEIHVPISPAPDYLLRIHYLAASIEMYAGLVPGSYRIVVTVGDGTRVDVEALCPWSRFYPIEWRWLPDEEWNERGIFATAYTRFRYDFDADVVVMLDADVLVTGSIAERVDAAAGTLTFQAIPAPYSPFFSHHDRLDRHSPSSWWKEIFRLAGLGAPALTMEHLAWPWVRNMESPYLEEMRFSPAYANAGVIIGSAETMRRIGSCIYAELDTVNSVFESALSGQIALSLAIVRQGLEWSPLPLRFNVPNVSFFHDTYSKECADVRILHFLQTTEIDRTFDFQSYTHVERVMERQGLAPLNAHLARRLRAVYLDRILPDLQALADESTGAGEE